MELQVNKSYDLKNAQVQLRITIYTNGSYSMCGYINGKLVDLENVQGGIKYGL